MPNLVAILLTTFINSYTELNSFLKRLSTLFVHIHHEFATIQLKYEVSIKFVTCIARFGNKHSWLMLSI